VKLGNGKSKYVDEKETHGNNLLQAKKRMMQIKMFFLMYASY
jgi:hypothetical protein